MSFRGALHWKRPLGTSRLRWEDNIGMDLREIGWEGVDWMHLAQDKNQWWTLVSAVMRTFLTS
jgi:hypothetical protein